MYDAVMIASLCVMLPALAFGLAVAALERPSTRLMRVATWLCAGSSLLAIVAMVAMTIAEIAIRTFAL